jgi:hypothetical protein
LQWPTPHCHRHHHHHHHQQQPQQQQQQPQYFTAPIIPPYPFLPHLSHPRMATDLPFCLHHTHTSVSFLKLLINTTTHGTLVVRFIPTFCSEVHADVLLPTFCSEVHADVLLPTFCSEVHADVLLQVTSIIGATTAVSACVTALAIII